jgi:hypothetical protein
MTTVLPTPYEPLVDKDGKVSEVWYRYLSQAQAQLNTITTASTLFTAVAFSSFATQADEEAGTSTQTVVSPSVQQYHRSAAKAWGNVACAGTVATLTTGNYNVASITGVASAGQLLVELTVPFSSSNYSVVASPIIAVSSDATALGIGSLATTGFMIVRDSTSLPPGYAFAAYGDQ